MMEIRALSIEQRAALRQKPVSGWFWRIVSACSAIRRLWIVWLCSIFFLSIAFRRARSCYAVRDFHSLQRGPVS